MLAFIDSDSLIKVYFTKRKKKTISIRYAYGKAVISGPRDLTKKEMMDIFYKYPDLINKYKIDINNLYIYLLGRKYSLKILLSNTNKLVLDDSLVYCYTKKMDLDYIKDLLKDYYNTNIKKYILDIKDNVIDRIKYVFNDDYSTKLINYKYTTSYYGCNYKNAITISSTLLKFNPKYYEYILAHEYIHFYVKDHSDLFYNKLLQIYPDYFDVIKLLKKDTKEFSLSII